uniref:Uncharacterized protein n=1 Tax=uncultured marine virus TaxID=186617 RepID=A0A0F7LCH0_9VIRU|nr:hypothetical protein P60_gp20 [uncultured marine virus]
MGSYMQLEDTSSSVGPYAESSISIGSVTALSSLQSFRICWPFYYSESPVPVSGLALSTNLPLLNGASSNPAIEPMSSYTRITDRKRSWTPTPVTKGKVLEGAESTLKRCLALRCLELPVKEMLAQGLEKDLPEDPGVIPALQSNMKDEDKHDLALQYVCDAHGVDLKAEAEAAKIRDAWFAAPEHPILKTAVLERSVFFVLLPFFRFAGDVGIRTVASDISRDEQTHVAVHAMVSHDLGYKSTENLNKLRKATIAWAMADLKTNDNRYLDKSFWMRQSESLYHQGKAPELAETQRSRMPAFFETSNVNLPQYG